jgi:hypothetical protein
MATRIQSLKGQRMSLKRTAASLALLALLAAGVTGAMISLAHSEEINGEYTATDTSTGKHVAAKYDGVQITEAKFEDQEWEVKCEKVSFAADSQSGTDTLLTMTPSYTECDAFYMHQEEGKEKVNTKFPTSVNMQGCDYEFEQPIEQKKDVYSGPMNIICKTKPFELIVHDPNFGNTKLFTGKVCTFLIYETKGLTKTTYEDDTVQKPTDFILDADISKITYEEQGTTCPDATNKKFTTGRLTGRSTITATTADGKTQIDASID